MPFKDPDVTATMESSAGAGGVLAENKRYAVIVLEGKDKGHVFSISKPRVTIGRTQCDIDLDDTELP